MLCPADLDGRDMDRADVLKARALIAEPADVARLQPGGREAAESCLCDVAQCGHLLVRQWLDNVLQHLELARGQASNVSVSGSSEVK